MMRGEMRAAGVERAYKVKRGAGRVVGGSVQLWKGW